MKKYLFRFLTLALIVPALASCSGQLEDNLPLAKKHTVYFSTVVDGQATRTGLAIDGNNVVPDWRSTDPEDVHLFEMNGTENALLGKAESVNSDDNDLVAHFKADFEEEITIIVTPPSNPDPDGDGAKVLRQGSNTYGAVVAKSKEVEGKTVFYIPAVQTPDAATLKDPGAEFLVGYSRDSYDAITLDEEGTVVDLYFDRVAALSRIGFTAFQGENEKVKSVTINSESSLTGSVISSDLAFGNPNSVTWTPDTGEGAGVLTLSYGDAGVALPEEGAFYAYFVSMPGTFKINSIVVETDQYRYTKAYADGKDLTFDLTKLANLSMDLATAEKEKIASNVWYKASMLEAGYDYIIVSNGHALVKNSDGEIPNAIEVEVATNNTISVEASEDILWRATAVTSDYGQCTLKNGSVYLYRSGYQADNLKVICEETSSAKYVPWRYDGSYLSNGKTTQYYTYYDGGWKMLLVSEGGTDKPSVTTLLFTNRAPQALDFGPEAIAQYDLYSETWTVEVPTLNGVQTSATYALSEDSNPAVATVDADGTVHPLSTGTVTIVATAAGNEAFQTGSASYTLTVVNSDPNVKVYHKVTRTADLEVGAQYLLVFEGLPENSKEQNHDPKVFRPTLASGGSTFNKQTTDALAVEIVDGTISSNDYEAGHFTLEEGYYLKADAVNKYIYPSGSSGSSGTLSAESSATNLLNITFNNGIVQIKAQSGTFYLVWSTSSYYFSSNADVEGQYSTGICLYKLDDGRQPQTLSFTPATATYDLYKPTSFIKPTLSTAYGNVTYSSSDDTIAEVDNSGNITGKKKGTVTITATAAGNNQYKPGSASYELTVENTDPNVKVYQKVTDVTDLEAGAQYLLVFEGLAGDTDGDGDPKVFVPTLASNGDSFNKQKADALDVVITNGTITSNDYIAGHLTLETGYFLKVDAVGKYIYPIGSTSGSGSLGAEPSGSHQLTISFDAGIAQIKNNNGYLVWSISSHYFSANTAVSGTYSTGICLYKLDDGRLPQSPSFSPSEVNYDMAGSAALVKPTLSNAFGNVTYSSSNEAIATVDSSTGDVTVKKKGNVEITASAAGNSQYKPGSASYTLKITNSSVTTPIWRKADAIEAGETYLIVSNGYALQNNGGSAAAVAVTVSDGVIEFDAPENAIFTATASSSNFTLQNDGQYMQRGGSSNNYVPTFSSSQGSYYQWTYDSTNEVVTAKGNNTYYVYYSTTNSKWSMSSSSADNRKAALYKLDDGSPKNQNLKFSETDVTYNMYGSPAFTAPTLSGAKTEVRYSSSVTSVATVNSSGEVAIQGEGTTIITANAPAGTVNGVSYNAGTASYTLTVTNVASKTYKYVSSISKGGTYLIAANESNESNLVICLFPDVKTFTSGDALNHKATDYSKTEESITISDAEILASEVELVSATDGKWLIKVKANNKYLETPTASYKITYTADESSAAAYTISSSNTSVSATLSGNYYFYHSNSAKGFTQRSNTSTVSNLRFYQLEEP